MKELRKVVGSKIVLAIAGNKCDMERQRNVNAAAALEYASSVGASHQLTSAKSGAGLDEIFGTLVTTMATKRQPTTGAGRGRAARATKRLMVVEETMEAERKGGGGCC